MPLLTPYWGLDGIIIFLSLLVAAYLFMTRKFKYWAKKGIEELPPTPFVGNFTDCVLMRKSASEFVKGIYDQAKGLPYIGFYIFDKPYFLARDPELVKNILVKDFNYFQDRYASADPENDRFGYANVFMMKNPAWKLLRTRLSPIFTSGKLKRMFDLMLLIADDLRNHLESFHLEGNGKILEFKNICANFTTDMIGSTAFGLKVNSLNDENAPFRVCGKTIFGYTFYRSIELLTIFFFPDLAKRIRAKFFGRYANKFLQSVFWDVINERIKSGEKRNDLIDLLIDLREKYKDDEGVDGFKFEGDDLVAQAMVFFSGGFETSSTTMSFTLYELALNPEVQKTLRKEIHEALEKTEGKITYEMAMTLPYLDMVISETLRKYPPLGFLDRVASADYKVPNSDLVLERNTPIFISMIGMHYDPDYFPDPEKFDPLRFTDEAKNSRPNIVYIPFGEGPHICIGMRLGLMQSKLGIMQVIKDYEVSPCDKTPIPMVLDPKGLTTTALEGIYLNVRRATTAAG